MKEYKKQKYMKTWNSLKKRLKTCTLANNHTHVQNFLLAFIDELWKTWKIIILKNLKKKKMLEVSSFYTCIPRYSSWDTGTHNFFCHFGPFLPFYPCPLTTPKTKILKKWKKHLDMSSFLTCATKNMIVWCMFTHIWSVTNITFCHFKAIFCSFTPLLTLKIKIWKKICKTPGDIILLHMCTTNQDRMMYGSWDIKCKGHSLSFWVIFALWPS